MPHVRPSLRVGALVAITALVASGCAADPEPTPDPGGATETGGTVVLLTHDSFSLPDELVAEFEAATGYTLDQRGSGNAGELTNGLVLAAGNPQGDVVFGVDNTFASRALAEGVFDPYRPDLPAGVADHLLPGDEDEALTPVDTGSVCVNIDTVWFAENDVVPPATLEDLLDPAYEGLFVLPGATTSSPGMAFLLATIAEYGERWPDYWTALLANDAKLTSGWSDAYFVEFTQGGGDNASRPIVLSYDSSPAFTIGDDGESTTAALLHTCFRQVEYAGVLAGADNPEGARAVVDWLLSTEVQSALPTSMYVFPVRSDVDLPEDWASHAEQPSETLAVDPAEITANRQQWLTTWTELISR
ncbi:thiamine ABC transporter substrate-binding protein [Nocardioides limicola]|uniref:thiamine ABC transporter substrate-binding protein n=1 Tax=Nocardioides limicola TaxID=2803368 RepID=UPI00193B30EC|nr:thiamine ABC transporter substrate-binding protein [Nocardioides sp. DJM-14]